MTIGHIASGTMPRAEPPSRVLVVDDEPAIGTTLAELLAPDNQVVAVQTAREALTRLREDDRFDVIFCDVFMPQMSGIDLYHCLRVELPGLERRIVFMSGGVFTSSMASFLASVDNRRIEKPFSLGLIERIVRDMTRSRARGTGASRA